MNLDIKESFEKTRIAGSVAAGALDEVRQIIQPGIETEKIDGGLAGASTTRFSDAASKRRSKR